MFDLSLFDLDGTLVDTRRDIEEAVNHVLQLHARPVVELATVISWVGAGVAGRMVDTDSDALYLRNGIIDHSGGNADVQAMASSRNAQVLATIVAGHLAFEA